MLVKIHKNDRGQTLVAVCDSELIDKKFEEGKLQLNLTNNFYKGEKKTDDEIGDLMRNAYAVNIVGEKSIALAIKEEIIEKEHVRTIQGIPCRSYEFRRMINRTTYPSLPVSLSLFQKHLPPSF